MQKHVHTDQARRNRLVVFLILAVLALATVTVMYIRAVQQIDELKGGEGRFFKGKSDVQLQVDPSSNTSGIIGPEI